MMNISDDMVGTEQNKASIDRNLDKQSEEILEKISGQRLEIKKLRDQQKSKTDDVEEASDKA